MILGTALSKNGVNIRLTEERWLHIISSHLEINPTEFLEILETIENPDVILKGDKEELIAARKKPGNKFWIVVPYKETSKSDGFVITAYITTDSRWLFQRKVIWNKKS